MADRNSDGEVISNLFSMALLQEQKIFASMVGGEPCNGIKAEKPDNVTKVEYSTASQHDEELGFDLQVPKDIEVESFASKVPTSDDQLLKQILGEKAAKAHLNAQKARAIGAKPPNQNLRKTQPAPRKADDEDDGEGRAATLVSKKQKIERKRPVKSPADDSENHDGVTQDAVPNLVSQMSDDSDGEEITKTISKSKQRPSKPTGFLDQVLAERSKKKKKNPKS